VTLRHKLADRGSDLYETPSVAVEALLKVEQLPRHIWEPAAGRGSIVRVLRDAGHIVTATDLVDRGIHDIAPRIDFLLERQAPEGVEAIVTNPPYSLCGRRAPFVAHALELVPRVVLLLRLQFLEGILRGPLLDRGGLARVHIFRGRLPMMHRDGWEGPKSTSQTCFAWFSFDRTHCGPTILNWLSVPPVRKRRQVIDREDLVADRPPRARQRELPLMTASTAGMQK
jgi:hypothetical protein